MPQPPHSLLVYNQEAEEWEQHIEHKNDCQRPTHTNRREDAVEELAQVGIVFYYQYRLVGQDSEGICVTFEMRNIIPKLR